jgi:hypothetical protein
MPRDGPIFENELGDCGVHPAPKINRHEYQLPAVDVQFSTNGNIADRDLNVPSRMPGRQI